MSCQLAVKNYTKVLFVSFNIWYQHKTIIEKIKTKVERLNRKQWLRKLSQRQNFPYWMFFLILGPSNVTKGFHLKYIQNVFHLVKSMVNTLWQLMPSFSFLLQNWWHWHVYKIKLFVVIWIGTAYNEQDVTICIVISVLYS